MANNKLVVQLAFIFNLLDFFVCLFLVFLQSCEIVFVSPLVPRWGFCSKQLFAMAHADFTFDFSIERSLLTLLLPLEKFMREKVLSTSRNLLKMAHCISLDC